MTGIDNQFVILSYRKHIDSSITEIEKKKSKRFFN